MGAVGNGTRGIFGNGYSFGQNGYVNTIDYVTIATTGNATDFGDMLGDNLVIQAEFEKWSLF